MKKGHVIINAQQKGGVGKTTDSCMESLVASLVFNKKVLFIDTDLQGNGTTFLAKSFKIEEMQKTLMKCLEDGNLSDGIIKLHENLDMIPCGYDMRKYTDFLIENFKTTKDRTFYFAKLLDKIKYDYDYIFIDIPPSTDLKVDNAMVASDFVIVVQETQQFSYEGSQRLIFDYLQTLVDDFGHLVKMNVVGILPVLLQKKRSLHNEIVKNTIDTFGEENVFSTIINNHARLEWYPRIGFQFEDHHDKRMLALFCDIFCELEERIHLFETKGDIVDYKYTPKYFVDNKLTKLGKGIDIGEFTKERATQRS
ncbi:ParA superfamily DNA segregation protein PrgP [Bacillus cereus]|uniref:AAA domain-containing protein n=2 Tax=Bacillus cereus group TaxID=86661 RepID=A0A9W5QCI5_BACCE|nr:MULTISPECIES: ParA superfamily DNA segregation protein PrgP [Bacillus]AIE37102.1 Rep63B [Bacillus thuringiensis serovar kurstaki str. HD-1]AJK38486.1 ATPase MipZ family protein [Bacillus thuringiensis serovar kurstaki]AKJ62980.1 CobQ/CobB/MinD/ParA nucleotide binding domain protein [Bacillus thuringiensis]ALL62418.1 chromosome partitioning protein ParA [Bacillus thuringiensis]AMX80613.1 chromosome partitioning protein ParA [Bacillus thuringiensis]